ncbi:hypothetical protein IHE45_12G072300 [Dioscorea alata]|uniref:Uncharacterized protein n=1 Tax=Dioscorea alata TaxID=55571 RepID=A0ACB7V2Q3_DIOAL|nr:hypothetical protein IHE45_12G072300 [Dioscorea alata]
MGTRARLFLKNRQNKHRRSMGRSQWSTLVAISLLIVATFVLSKDAVISDAGNEEIYQIDYRGPETHSALPPPEISRADPKPKPKMKHHAHKTRKIRHG